MHDCTQVNLLFPDDSKAPGGLNYNDTANQLLFEVSHISGGGYYQVQYLPFLLF